MRKNANFRFLPALLRRCPLWRWLQTFFGLAGMSALELLTLICWLSHTALFSCVFSVGTLCRKESWARAVRRACVGVQQLRLCNGACWCLTAFAVARISLKRFLFPYVRLLRVGTICRNGGEVSWGSAYKAGACLCSAANGTCVCLFVAVCAHTTSLRVQASRWNSPCLGAYFQEIALAQHLHL